MGVRLKCGTPVESPGAGTMGAAERERRIMDQWKHDDRPDRDSQNRDWAGRRRHKTLRTVLLKVLPPLVIVGGSVAVMIVLHLDGTLRTFLDQQSMFGMIAVVLVLNIVGFTFIYMLSMFWKSVKHDLLHYRDL
jgi:hypothetical protein